MYTGKVGSVYSRFQYKKTIKKFIPKQLDDWKKFPAYKESMREYYYNEQNGRCYYCREELYYKGGYEPLEHIIPKEHDCRLMFDPYNLILACDPCNTNKGRKNPLRKGKRRCTDPNAPYIPTLSSEYRIMHGHLDNYEDNIEHFDQYYLKAITAKGLITILVCGLFRPELAISKIKRDKISKYDAVKNSYFRLRDRKTPKWQKIALRKSLLEIVNSRDL